MFDVSVLDQKIAGRVDDGAEFSVAGNPSTGFLQWSVAGAAAFVLRDTCPVVPEGRAPQDLLISGWAVAPYIEFSGSGTSAAVGNSLLKAGVKTELQLFAGSFFDVQQVQIAPYALTDFGFAGRGYGVTVDWIPVSLDAHLNGYIGTADQTAWWWTFKLNADALRVDSPGTTGLPTAYYAWAGGKIGLNAKFKVLEKAPALTVGADYSFFHDFLGGTNAGLFSAIAKMPLDTSENASLVLDYKIGSDYKTLQNLNRVKLSLAVKF
ncbi:MAG: hypothetical protein IPL47_01990 [Phyllobacteriaceae bacterium]|nr:hypothetical protein [Phyllobacteriaceae bacterium]